MGITIGSTERNVEVKFSSGWNEEFGSKAESLNKNASVCLNSLLY